MSETEFNEQAAIAAMRATLSPESSRRIDDDELLLVLDTIWDWYEDHGLLDIDADPDGPDLDIEALISHVRKTVAKDPDSPIDGSEVDALVRAEIAYEESVQPFNPFA